MADFELIVVSGATLVNWTDPTVAGKPSRINAFADVPHSTYSLPVATPLDIGALVGGVSQPLDAALGGRLFLWSWLDVPVVGPPGIPAIAGQTSKTLFPADHFLGREGHYTILLSRDDGGAQMISWEVEP